MANEPTGESIDQRDSKDRATPPVRETSGGECQATASGADTDLGGPEGGRSGTGTGSGADYRSPFAASAGDA